MRTERQIVDAYTRRALLLLRVANGITADAERRLRKLADELRGLLGGLDLSALGRRDLAALLRDVEAAIDACYEDIDNETTSSIDQVGDDEYTWAAALFGLRKRSSNIGGIASLLVLGLPFVRLWQRQRANSTDRITAIIRTAAGTGQGTDEVIKSIIGEGQRGRERGGVLETDRTQAGTIVHTAVRAGTMDAQRKAWKDAGVKYLRWHSILDTRTTIGCAVRAGRIYTVDGEPVGHDVPLGVPPPSHWNCRSILVPMAPGWEPPGDGQDLYIESLDDWLKRQSEADQDAMLGPTRAALWRTGRITSRDLLGRGGEALSVAELAAHAGPEARVMAWTGEVKYRRVAAELTPEMRAAGAAHGLTEVEMVALRHYTEDGYDALNTALREGREGRATIAADVLNGALSKLPAYNGSVVRRVLLDSDALAKHVPGNVVDYPAFTSATKNVDRDVMRRKPHRLIIESQTGRYIAPWSATQWQQEVLFGLPVRFEVESVIDTEQWIEIRMHEVRP